MITVYFLSLIFILFIIPFSIFFNSNNEISLYTLSRDIIFAIIFVSFLSLLLNFFFPINTYISSIPIIISILIIFFNREKFFKLEFFYFLLIKSFLITLLILESNVYRPDAGLYHLPYIGILNTDKILIGLSNLHFRYGHVSIIQHFSAISNNFIFKDNGIVFVQALIASSVIINFAYQIFNYNNKKVYNFHFFYLLFVFIYISYKMNRYSEYGNDAPAHFILFFLISEILNKKIKLNYSSITNQFVLASFIVFNKLTLLFAIFLPIINLKNINFLKLLINRRFIFIFLFFVLWIGKNILTTGCAIYPATFTCANGLPWTNLNETKRVSIASEAWAKGWSNKDANNLISQEEFNKNFNWLNAWSQVHLKKIIEIILPYIIFLILILIIIRRKNKRNKDFKLDKNNIYYFIIISLGLLLWALKSPLYRYGYSYLIIFISFIFSFYITRFENSSKYYKPFFIAVLILSINVIIIKNIQRIVVTNNNFFNYPWPKYYSMNIDNKISNFKKIKVGNKEILIPENSYCMYIKEICIHYDIKGNLKEKKYKSYNIFYHD